MEDEMTLDGAIISASFDEALETVSNKHLSSCLLVLADSYLRNMWEAKWRDGNSALDCSLFSGKMLHVPSQSHSPSL